MRTFVQIQDNVAHWVFQADERPVFAPYIEIREVIDVEEMPKEGWQFDRGGDKFVPPPPAPTPVFTSGMGLPGLTLYHNLAVHQHATPHYGFAARGTMKLTVGLVTSVLVAPAAVDLPANVPHSIEAISDDAVFLSVVAGALPVVK